MTLGISCGVISAGHPTDQRLTEAILRLQGGMVKCGARD
jgi:hypothetical protein